MQHIHPGYIIPVLIGLMIAGACAPYYIPGSMPTPQFDSTRDTYLAAGVGFSGWQGNIAIAPAYHFWLAGHVGYIPFTDTTEFVAPPLNSSSLGHLHGEFGLGWYSRLDDEDIRVSILGGYGRGRSSLTRLKEPFIYIDSTQRYWEFGGGDFETYFLQLSGESTRLSNDSYMGLLLRSEYIRFKHFLLDGQGKPLPTALLIEPRFVAGVPLKIVPTFQFEMQIGFQIRVAGREQFDFEPIHISFTCMGLLDLL